MPFDLPYVCKTFLENTGYNMIKKGNSLKINAFLFLFILISAVCIPSAFSQSFDFSMSNNGILNPRNSYSWTYPKTSIGGFFLFRTTSNSEIDTASPGLNLSKSVTNVENDGFLKLIPAFYSIKYEKFHWKPGIGIYANTYKIQEVGFQDVIMESNQYRLFFNNERDIYVVQPGLFTLFKFQIEELSLTLDGFYSPWFYLHLNQEFSSAAEGTDVFDTPITSHIFSGSGFHSWNGTLSIDWETEVLSLGIKTDWEGVILEYSYIGLGGTIYSSVVNNITGLLDITTKISIIKLNGFSPVIGFTLGWDINADTIRSPDWVVSDIPYRILIGLKQ